MSYRCFGRLVSSLHTPHCKSRIVKVKCQVMFEWGLACTRSKQMQSSSFVPIVQHFVPISNSCTARAEDSLRPLVDYKYNSVRDGVGIMSYRYKISERCNYPSIYKSMHAMTVIFLLQGLYTYCYKATHSHNARYTNQYTSDSLPL